MAAARRSSSCCWCSPWRSASGTWRRIAASDATADKKPDTSSRRRVAQVGRRSPRAPGEEADGAAEPGGDRRAGPAVDRATGDRGAEAGDVGRRRAPTRRAPTRRVPSKATPNHGRQARRGEVEKPKPKPAQAPCTRGRAGAAAAPADAASARRQSVIASAAAVVSRATARVMHPPRRARFARCMRTCDEARGLLSRRACAHSVTVAVVDLLAHSRSARTRRRWIEVPNSPSITPRRRKPRHRRRPPPPRRAPVDAQATPSIIASSRSKIGSRTTSTPASSSTRGVSPVQGKYRRPLSYGEFYDLVGRGDLADRYRSRRNLKIGFAVAGGVAFIAGMGAIIGQFLSNTSAFDSCVRAPGFATNCDGSSPRQRRLRRRRHPRRCRRDRA